MVKCETEGNDALPCEQAGECPKRRRTDVPLCRVSAEQLGLLAGVNLTRRYRLDHVSPFCKNEPIGTQPVFANTGVCSGFLIDVQQMATFLGSSHPLIRNYGSLPWFQTASHCVTAGLKRYVVLFGFDKGTLEEFNEVDTKDLPADVKELWIPQSNIVHPRVLLAERHDYPTCDASQGRHEHDHAVLALDGDADRPPLVVTNSKNVPKGAKPYMVGHPVGAMMKVTVGAGLRGEGNESRSFFEAAIDAATGNSGSPVAFVVGNSVQRSKRGRPIVSGVFYGGGPAYCLADNESSTSCVTPLSPPDCATQGELDAWISPDRARVGCWRVQQVDPAKPFVSRQPNDGHPWPRVNWMGDVIETLRVARAAVSISSNTP